MIDSEGAGPDYGKEMMNRLSPEIQRVLGHPFLQALSEGKLTKQQLKQFAEQYDFYCQAFPNFLLSAAHNTTDENVRAVIIRNLYDEYGGANPEKNHRTLYKKFLTGIQRIQPEANVAASTATPLPEVARYISTLDRECGKGHTLVNCGMLGPGCELFTSAEYQLIMEGLKKYGLTTDELEFWLTHISIDDQHGGEMLNVLKPYLKNEGERKNIEKGARRAIELEVAFWDTIQKNIIK